MESQRLRHTSGAPYWRYRKRFFPMHTPRFLKIALALLSCGALALSAAFADDEIVLTNADGTQLIGSDLTVGSGETLVLQPVDNSGVADIGGSLTIDAGSTVVFDLSSYESVLQAGGSIDLLQFSGVNFDTTTLNWTVVGLEGSGLVLTPVWTDDGLTGTISAIPEPAVSAGIVALLAVALAARNTRRRV